MIIVIDIIMAIQHENLNTTHPNKTNVEARRQNKCRVNKENYDKKEDYITILQEPKLEKIKKETEKGKQIIVNYANGHHP